MNSNITTLCILLNDIIDIYITLLVNPFSGNFLYWSTAPERKACFCLIYITNMTLYINL